ncbi:MAG: selenocysteine-specific translation elongation factor [Betaproteobacteria bacterium]|nr:selenocysteine-specific translation elongation factor [Betaproteobacteria bacterium]
MIVATAGHIDHGKTLLVKRLTGVDTDRLPEEKARGISIDLGFAYIVLAGGGTIGFVDVPGHERFIRNMLAGVCGIDFVLLVVAADDGVMPQTVEHLHIVDLLHISRGIAVITKTDRVPETRVREVAEDVAALLATTRLARIPVLPVSALTGAGVEELRARLEREAAVQVSRHAAGRNFRYAIDRAFTIAGSGTVVTGTVFTGAVAAGDRLMVSPGGIEVRVRAIQKHGRGAGGAIAGERCALNLAGADLAHIRRGDWVLAPAVHAPTRRIDARIAVLTHDAHPLQHWTPLHLHLATADVTARVAIPRGAALAPGASALAQLVLDQPIACLNGDRFILRDQSATRTIGGGIVVDPFAPASRRSARARLAELAALEQETPEAALGELIRVAEQGVDLARFERTFNLTAEHAAELYRKLPVAVLGREQRIALPRERHEQICARVLETLSRFHRETPQSLGKDIEVLHRELALKLPLDAFHALLRGLAEARRVEVSGAVARLPGHDATSNPQDEKLWQALAPALKQGGFAPPAVRDLAASLKLKDSIVRDFLHRKSKSGEVLKIAADRFYPRGTLAQLAAVAQATAQRQPNGQFTAAQYRDAVGVGRSLAIEILEFLDTLGITQRIGDARKMRRDFVPLLGPAPEPGAAAGKSAPQAPARDKRGMQNTKNHK